MAWIELIVHTNTATSDDVSSLLMAQGAAGTQTEDRADIPDPAKPSGIWEIIDPAMLDAMPEDVLVHAWLEMDSRLPARFSALQEGLARLRDAKPDCGSLKLETREVPDEDWAESWKQSWKPLRAGKHFVIKPTWENLTPQPEDRVIEMDPGMAFGSGYHETTALCLALLEENVHAGDRVIDVGTGSGILAIGAAMAGAGSVLAIDIDPDAVRVARENVIHNGVDACVRVQEGNLLDRVEEVCDLCTVNIIAQVLCAFARPLVSHIRPGGLLICSGIISSRKEDVRDALLEAGYEILEIRPRGEWVAFLARRPE